MRALLNAPGWQVHLFLSSDDGSMLLLNDKVLVDNDGVHTKSMKGTTKLMGKHKVELRYFEKGGGENLSVLWTGRDLRMCLSKTL